MVTKCILIANRVDHVVMLLILQAFSVPRVRTIRPKISLQLNEKTILKLSQCNQSHKTGEYVRSFVFYFRTFSLHYLNFFYQINQYLSCPSCQLCFGKMSLNKVVLRVRVIFKVLFVYD